MADAVRKYPRGIRILALVSLAKALVIPPVCVLALIGLHSFRFRHHPATGGISKEELIFGVQILLLVSTQLCIGVGLWKLRNWARVLASYYYAFGLFLSSTILMMRFLGSVDTEVLIGALLGAVLCGWILWYLSRPHVKAAFGVHPSAPLDK